MDISKDDFKQMYPDLSAGSKANSDFKYDEVAEVFKDWQRKPTPPPRCRECGKRLEPLAPYMFGCCSIKCLRSLKRQFESVCED